MAKIDDGGLPAFPCQETEECKAWDGMTLRDYFAGQAITAIIPREGWVDGKEQEPAEAAARQSYLVADAMIAARKVVVPNA